MIPSATIICMAISMLVAIGLPISLFIGLRKRLALSPVPMLVGVGVFIVFALVLEQLLHRLVLHTTPSGQIALLITHPALYVLYGIFAAGVFEETGRLVGFLILRRRFTGVRTAISYGIGHGGIEAILLVGLTMISNIVLAILANAGVLTGQIYQPAITTLSGTAPAAFLVAGMERIFAITIHLSLSILVWVAVTRRGHWWLFPLAIVLHAASDLSAACYQAGWLGIPLTESLTGIAAVVVALYAITWLRRCLADERQQANEQQLMDASVAQEQQQFLATLPPPVADYVITPTAK